MKTSVVLVWLLAFVILGALASIDANHPLQKFRNNPNEFKSALNKVQAFMTRYKEASRKVQLSDLTVECAICGIAVNEIEGFLIENITQSEIIDTITNDLCNLFPSGDLRNACDNLVEQIPSIITLIESKNTVSVVCIEIGYCLKPFGKHADPSPVPTYIINLDLPPSQRWTQVCSNPAYAASAQFLYSVVSNLLSNGAGYLGDIGAFLNDYYFPSDYGQEIKGCAPLLGIPHGWLALFNLGYEVSDACTSIVAQTKSGKIYHARNMDFWAGMGFTDTLKNITFIS